jgi:L-threonylcarbamoyladenylate synthase
VKRIQSYNAQVKLFHAEKLQSSDYAEIVSLLKAGGVIAFPTDTAYGLGADPFNNESVERVFSIKGRPESKPILLLVDSIAMAETVSQPPDFFYDVAQHFWPGPLTMIVPAKSPLLMKMTAGTNTIGLRWPIARFATSLVESFGKPITATSANSTGMPTPITAAEVRLQIGEAADALIDGGTLPSRAGSTLLDLTVDPAVVLREGPITRKELADFFGGRIRRFGE